MKVESLGKPVGPTPATEARPRPGPAYIANTGEQVQLSPLGSTLQKAEAALAETPSIDRARVEEIKQAIREGRFKIDTDRIADGLINEVRQMFDSKIGRDQ
ncbi:MAG: flagellar biosynthesis anti-sigma factor FlgM [Azoarcus sp.]|jgi:negative regulator of flagellin synthesis FlgM|nr:flagellar biosynthesis anti-sigma factor FlgM [Azoarcus sp.]